MSEQKSNACPDEEGCALALLEVPGRRRVSRVRGSARRGRDPQLRPIDEALTVERTFSTEDRRTACTLEAKARMNRAWARYHPNDPAGIADALAAAERQEARARWIRMAKAKEVLP